MIPKEALTKKFGQYWAQQAVKKNSAIKYTLVCVITDTKYIR